MFVKTIIAILVTLAAAWLTHSATATVATFLVAMIIVILLPHEEHVATAEMEHLPEYGEHGIQAPEL